MQPIPSKTCTKCGKSKAVSDFRVRPKVKSGLVSSCKECESAWQRDHYAKNREIRLAQAQAWYAANKDRKSETARKWYVENKDRNYANSRRWIEANRESYTEFMRRRRAAIAASVVGPVDLDSLWTGSCGICLLPMDRDLSHPDPMSKSVDHIIPIARGGAHEQSNLQWAHLRCNISKGARLPDTA